METLTTQCLISGGGPAGMMAGLLLARAGVEVVVVEQYPDFLRDFRGDTVHPSTLRVIEELGYIDEFLQLPHHKVSTISIADDQGEAVFADFSRLRGRFCYVAFMPQWDLLEFLASKARRYANFTLLQSTKVTNLIIEDNQVVGVRIEADAGEREIRANLVLSCDGRHSTLRQAARMKVAAQKAPMDVLWFRISKQPDEVTPFVHTGTGFVLVCVDRGDYWQLAYVIAAGSYDRVRAQGLDNLADDLTSINPTLGDRFVDEVVNWDDVKLLSVSIDRLRKWHRPGLLCIGDAAHAMSPAGGVGINLAIQDAVAASRILAPVLIAGRRPTEKDLARVQRRRQWAVRAIQMAQVRILADLYPSGDQEQGHRPQIARLVQRLPTLQGLVARVIGIGLRPEHLDTAW